MKVVLLFLATAVYIATAVPAPSELPRFIEVLGDDGEMIKVDLQVEPNMELINDLARNPRNSYHLFTRSNPTVSQVLALNNANSILNSNFNPAHPTIAIAHGYTQSARSTLNAVIRDAYLGAMEANVIVLDWSPIAQMDYYSAINAIPSVGQGLGNFLGFVSSVTGAPLASMHLAGFSLGSHVVGNAGRAMNGQFGRVTGLDPFSPIWLINRNRLASTDAIYVEAIHTSGNEGNHFFGDVDYFVNGGDNQPGCWLSLCSHNRSWEIFAATVTFNHLWGNQCSTAAQIKSNACTGSMLPLGNSDVNKRARNPTVSQVLALNNAISILNSNFNPAHPTIAIAHGYTQSARSTLNAVIRDAYLGAMEANVIVLDWSPIAQMDYYSAINAIPSVGQGLGNFLNFVSSVTGAPLTSMHMAGFSLGSHVVGNAGRTMNGRIARVTGLDPFSPVWLINRNRLARTDGLYVEAIHTSGNEGDHFFGDVDYFVNGGDNQPGCLLSLCSHNRSWEVFAATVRFNHLWGNQCSTAAQIKSNACTGSMLPLGNSDVNKRATGMYRVNTLASYPY